MPELPEVEVVREVLEASIVGKKISRIDCFYDPIIVGSVEEFKHHVIGQEILKINRYAKYLIFVFQTGAVLSHLRMEGKYYYLEQPNQNIKYVHVIFHFEDGTMLYYADMRKFGRMMYKGLEELYQTPPLFGLGIEANQSNYSLDEIVQKIHTKRIPIKTILLDQTVISGLGNIYADEVLFKAQLLPTKRGCDLTPNEVMLLMDASKEILDQAILMKGTTIRSYTSSLGVEGSYQNYLMVHTKDVCPHCKESLVKEKIGGRTTYYCPKCQR